MATKKDVIPREARLLLTRLEHQHTNATAQQWAELRSQMLSAVDGLPTAGHKTSALETEFDLARDRALARRRLHLVRTALAAGRAVKVGDHGQWEEFAVRLDDGEELSFLVPSPAITDQGAQVSRTAALAGRCSHCRAQVVVASNELTIAHKRRCAAASYQLV